MIKKIFGLIIIIGIILIFYLIKKKAIPINCACGEPPWWAVCKQGTSIDSENCAVYRNTMKQLNSVYIDINNTFKSLQNSLNNIIIPKIPTMPINLKNLVNNSFDIPKLDTNFILIPSVNISCPIPNPIPIVQNEINKIISQFQNISSGLNNLINDINKIKPAEILKQAEKLLNDAINEAKRLADEAKRLADEARRAVCCGNPCWPWGDCYRCWC